MQFNTLILVADSCRWDTFERAATPNIDDNFEIVKAGAHATFTYPAHAAMFQGFYPDVEEDRPLYNHFSCSLFSWHYRNSRKTLRNLQGAGTIPKALKRDGYRTVAVGGVGWFNKSSPLSSGFEKFFYKPQTELAIDTTLRYLSGAPFYALTNFGVTHRPYIVPGEAVRPAVPARSGTFYDSSHRHDLHQRQIKCLEYLDDKLAVVFNWLHNRSAITLVCFCADHGDCMGEDGNHGHGFYHPNVMQVPLGWSIFAGGKGIPVTTTSLKEHGFLID